MKINGPDHTSPIKKTMGGAINKLVRLLRPEKREITLLYTYAIISGLLSLTLPLGVQAIITYLMGAYLSSSLVMLITLVIGGTVVVGILQIFQLTIVETLQQKIFYRATKEYAFRIPLLNRLMNKQALFDELGNRFFDTLTLQKQVPKLLMDLSTALLQMVFGLILISFYHPFFAFFSLLLVSLLFLFFRVSGPKGFKSSMEESEEKFELAFQIQRSGRDHWWLKAASSLERYMGKMDIILTRYLSARREHFRILLKQYQLLVLFKTIIISILLIIGGNLVLDGQINLGQFIAAEIVVLLIMASVEKLLLSMEGIYDVLTAVEKVAVVPQKQIDLSSEMRPSESPKEMSFIDLNLSYAKHYVLHQFNAELNARSHHHLVLEQPFCRQLFIRMMQGHLLPDRGELKVNGMDLRLINVSWLRQHIRKVERVEAAKSGSLLDRLDLEVVQVNQNHERLNRILDLLGINTELSRNRINIYEELTPSWYFNTELSLWSQGIARALMSDAKLILIDLDELPRALNVNSILDEICQLSEAGVWILSGENITLSSTFKRIQA
ncbi:MAG: ABC transporter ATP-binding protein [Bacteroidetes bacterium]|nr:MAG: ABC transporter ATP-binding protein [Bacteroidota bacterium]